MKMPYASGKGSGFSGFVAVAAAVCALAVAGVIGYGLGQRTASDPQTAAAAGKAERKPLYYRNPMGLPDTSPVPKKDPMGMDYIPVYEGEDDGMGDATASGAAGQIRLSTEKIQKLGVRSEPVARRVLERTVRAVARVEADERRTFAISPKFEGYVERLFVNVTGQPVSRGQALFEVYSPELFSAQREYAVAVQGVEATKEAGDTARSGMRQLAESSLLRLWNWDVPEGEIKALTQSGAAKRTLTFRSPVSGIVTEKKALQGMRFMPGEALYQVADLSSVWVVADLPEQDIGLVRPGSPARVTIDAYPEKRFEGRIAYVYPTLNAATRTVPVRVELANPGLLLKPAMFGAVELSAGGRGAVLAVPDSAVIDSGVRRMVIVDHGEGRFEPRDVKLGARGDGYVEVIDGVREGEPVVVAANFLIDAESNLKAAIGGFGHAGHGNAAPSASGAAKSPDTTGAGATAKVGHRAEGTVDEIDARAGTLSINHGPVASLKWPAMTMEFKVANAALLTGVRSGMPVSFEFVERGAGEWVITAIVASKPAASGAPAAASAHAGHSGPSGH